MIDLFKNKLNDFLIFCLDCEYNYHNLIHKYYDSNCCSLLNDRCHCYKLLNKIHGLNLNLYDRTLRYNYILKNTNFSKLMNFGIIL